MSKSASAIPVAILVRVSTTKQETTRQVSELAEYAQRKGYDIVEVCEEQVSYRAHEADPAWVEESGKREPAEKAASWAGQRAGIVRLNYWTSTGILPAF